MKKLSILLSLMVALAACSPSARKEHKTTAPVSQQKSTYTCTMHPDIKVNKPGKCPTCGMDLVKAE